jgi:hypothetical protein
MVLSSELVSRRARFFDIGARVVSWKQEGGPPARAEDRPVEIVCECVYGAALMVVVNVPV